MGTQQTSATVATQSTVRNAGWLFVQQAAQVASGVLFTLVVPRTMGGEGYGQYALVASLSLWFVLGSRLGITQVLGRYVPQVERGEELRALMGRLLSVQLAVGAVAAGCFLLVTRLWLSEIDGWALTTIALVVLLRSLSGLFSSLLYGLGRAPQWGLSQTLRGWLSIAGLAGGYRMAGLRGAALGLLLVECAVLAVNVSWTLPHVGWLQPRRDLRALRPYAELGLIFGASELVGTSARRSGEVLLRTLAQPYLAIGHFGLAYDIASMGTVAFAQVISSFLPLCVTLRGVADGERMARVMEGLLKALAALGVVVLIATLLLGPLLIPRMLGASFAPVATYLVPLALLLITTALGGTARQLCIVRDRPRVALISDLLQLGIFWLAGVPLTLWLDALGLGIAAALASLVTIFYVSHQLGALGQRLVRAWLRVVALGALCVPLCLLAPEGAWRWPVLVAVTGLYAGLLLLSRTVTPAELRWIAAMLSRPAGGRRVGH
ncbi:MAG: lipopolysaccharide biosynthesis protein [Chloroflexi bacterium]|nr:lipopolysaccharide biosynthesis protein [Chloroflexota bacterium]